MRGASQGENKSARGLSRRELDVLELVCAGLADKEIASRLGVARSTVSQHVHSLLLKTGTANRTALAAWAIFGDTIRGPSVELGRHPPTQQGEVEAATGGGQPKPDGESGENRALSS